jgi:anthranilate phosphoribosyltransferase
MDILKGRKGAPRDVVVLNAAFALCAANVANSPMDGIAAAVSSIESGAALSKLQKLVELTAKLSA